MKRGIKWKKNQYTKIGEQMLAHVIEQFDVELKQTEFGPKLQGTKEELEKAQDYIVKVMKERLDELDRR